MSKVAVVTGANKGIGFAIVAGLCKRFDGAVYLTSRDEIRGKEGVEKLTKTGLNPKYYPLDVANRGSVARFSDFMKEKHGGLDILINNAGVLENTTTPSSYEDSKEIININYKSVLTMRELVYPLIRDSGRILNISSSCGHLSNIRNKFWIKILSKKDLNLQDVNGFVDWFLSSKKNGTLNPEDIADGATIPAYRVSKVALSAITKVHQKEMESRNISVNSMYPGLVRTDMTNGVGFYSVDQAAATAVYLVLDAPQTLKGEYVWCDGKVLDWYDYKADYNFKIKTLFE